MIYLNIVIVFLLILNYGICDYSTIISSTLTKSNQNNNNDAANQNYNNNNNNKNVPNKYLTHIFHKYGSNGVITFEGLEHLMYNLGLGDLEFEPFHTIEKHRPDGFNTPDILVEEKDETNNINDADANTYQKEINDYINSDDKINKTNIENILRTVSPPPPPPPPPSPLLTTNENTLKNDTYIDNNDNDIERTNYNEILWPDVTFKNIHDPKHRHPRHHDHHNTFSTKYCLSPTSIVRLFLNDKIGMQRKRRSLIKLNNNKNDENDEQYQNDNNQMLSANVKITPDDFLSICPALLVQIDQGSCTKQPILNDDSSHNFALAWIYATISVFIISICGLIGVAIVPLTKSNAYQEILRFLVALAIGTLCGDALMHLLPHALKPHYENEDERIPLFKNGNIHDEPIWLCACAFLSTLFMYSIENVLPLLGHHHHHHQHHHHHHQHHHHSHHPHQHHHHHHPHQHDNIHELPKSTSSIVSSTITPLSSSPQNTADKQINELEIISEGIRNKENTKELNVMLDDSKLDKKDELMGFTSSLSPIAFMVILGDGLHNLTDGLAIGAAFAVDPVTGMATSFAVLCHELPHELGDFALLLKTGVNLRRAIILNIISSVLSFIGMIIGLIIAGIHTGFVRWIYAGTAGTFIYIAFADLIPEMGRNGNTLKQMIIQMIGILLGGIIMFVIALYEDKLRILFE